MPLNKEMFITCFMASALGRQSHGISLAEDIDPRVMGKAINEATRNASLYWEELSGKEIKATPSKKENQAPIEWRKMTEEEFNIVQLAKGEPELFEDWLNSIVNSLYSKGANGQISPKQAKRVAEIGKKLEG